MASVNKETQMNLFFKLTRIFFLLFLMASFVVFIAAVGGFGGVDMPAVAMAAAGGIVGCSFMAWVSDQVVNATGG